MTWRTMETVKEAIRCFFFFLFSIRLHLQVVSSLLFFKSFVVNLKMKNIIALAIKLIITKM